MTVQMKHLSIQPDHHDYLGVPEGATDALSDETLRFDLLSIVRHILRERGDSNIIPVVRGFIVHPTNRWGHNAQVEVTYHTRGYRAIYGAHIGASVTNVQCYMD